jgi:hypothetical protein
VFTTADQLSSQLQSLLKDFPHSTSLDGLRAYFPNSRTPDSPGGHGSSRRAAKKRIAKVEDEHTDDEAFEVNSWESHWKKVMAPVVAAAR